MNQSKPKMVTEAHNNTGDKDRTEVQETSLSLLAGLRTQTPEAWHRLVRLYGPLVYNWCKRRGLQPMDIEDVMQEVFRTVFGRIEDYQHRFKGGTFRGWLWTITRNKLGDHIRRYQAQPQPAGGSEARMFLEQTALEEREEDEGPEKVGALYQRALDMIRGEFEPTTWQAFWLVVCEERRPADVAEELRLSMNAVYLAKSRILRRLRETLGEI